MSMFATPKVADRADSDELGKDDIIDTLAVFQVIDYDPNTVTKYGTSPTINAIVTVVDGPHAGRTEPRFFAAGNVARQIGEALDPMQMAPGRIVRGTSASGRSWYGINWAVDPADLARAEQAMRPPAPAAPKQSLGDTVRATTRDIRAAARQQTAHVDQDAPF